MMRGISGGATSMGAYLTNTLAPNTSAAEENSTMDLTLEPNGFNVHSLQDGSGTYIYVAIARPHKPASEFAATDLFAINNDTTTTSPKYVSGFPVDFALQNTVDETGYTVASSRLTGKQMYTPVEDAEEGGPEFDYSTGFKDGGGSTNADDYAWMWRRAKGFFDVVAYTGDGTSTSFSHNLGATPELKIIKNRDATFNWVVGGDIVTGGTTNNYIQLNSDGGTTSSSNYWKANDTSSVFSVRNGNNLSNANGVKFIAYLLSLIHI